ncbi:MAG: anti-sigma-I factor RsgI family protein [Mobilitalea sp.]
MNKTTIEKSLGNALKSAPTISFAELAALPYIKMSEHDYITAQEEKKISAHLRQFALAAACCILVMASLSGWYVQNRITSSTITLDVNPSIQIITNHKDKVLSVKALNKDAEVIVGDNDYKDAKLEETVIILMNSLVDQKYLDQEKNTILLSVMNKNAKKADAIKTEVDKTIRENLVAQNITPTIMSQIIAKETDLNYLASKYHISAGKMNLIQRMITLNNKLSLDMLANMSIEQLLKLAEKNSIDLSGYLSIDDGVTPSKETTEELQEDSSSLEDNEEQDEDNEEQGEDNEEQGEDNEEQGEDNEEQGEDNEEQGEDNEEQGEDNEEQGEDNEEQGEDNEKQVVDNEEQGEDIEERGEDNEEDSAEKQEDKDAYGNDDSDLQEKDEENLYEVKDNYDDNDQSDQINIERIEDEESENGEGDEGDNEDSI